MSVFFDFFIMSALLLAAKIIRVKVRLFQRLYIPAALIAGVLGLVLGPNGLGLLPFSAGMADYSGVLFAVFFGSMFIGRKKKASFRSMLNSVGETFLVNGAAEMLQYGFFMLLGAAVLPHIFSGIHTGFGLMLPAGFIGGHGTAAAMGAAFAENGWPDAATLGQTFASIGLLCGIIGGVILINIFVRKGETQAIKNIHEMPKEMQIGLISKDNRRVVGEETTSTMSIDTLAWHLSLVLAAVGGAYVLNAGLKKLIPSVSFPVYGLALVCSMLIQESLKVCKMDDYVDEDTVTHVGNSVTDYLVGFGMASINVNIVLLYWVPIVVLCILGIIFVLLFLLFVSRNYFSSFWFERGIYIYGMSTGIMATGAILLRIVDPEFQTGVIEDFGFAWIFLSVGDMILVSLCPMFITSGIGTVAGAALICLSLAFLAACKALTRRQNQAA